MPRQLRMCQLPVPQKVEILKKMDYFKKYLGGQGEGGQTPTGAETVIVNVSIAYIIVSCYCHCQFLFYIDDLHLS